MLTKNEMRKVIIEYSPVGTIEERLKVVTK